MPSRPYFNVYEIVPATTRHPDDVLNIDDINGSGKALVSAIQAALSGMKGKVISSSAAERRLVVQEVWHGTKWVDAFVKTGPFGAGADLVDSSGAVSTQHKDQATLRPVLLRFQSDPKANRVLWAASRTGSHGVFDKFRSELKQRMLAAHPDVTLHMNTLAPASIIESYMTDGVVSDFQVVTDGARQSIEDEMDRRQANQPIHFRSRLVITAEGGKLSSRKIRKLVSDQAERQEFIRKSGISDTGHGEIKLPFQIGDRQRTVVLPSHTTDVIGRVAFDVTSEVKTGPDGNPQVDWLRSEAEQLLTDLIG